MCYFASASPTAVAKVLIHTDVRGFGCSEGGFGAIFAYDLLIERAIAYQPSIGWTRE